MRRRYGTCQLACARAHTPHAAADDNNLPTFHTNKQLNGTCARTQVEWPGIPTYNATVSVAAQPGAAKVADILDLPKGARPSKRVNAKPIQFHFHANSENWVDGSQPPLEMHIVHTIPQSDLPGCDGTCYVALGVPFKLGKFNPVLDLIFRVSDQPMAGRDVRVLHHCMLAAGPVTWWWKGVPQSVLGAC